jgi:WD40 repeat protein
VARDVDAPMYVAGRDINITQYSREDRLDQRNRTILLDKVHQFWIEGVLEKSLHGVALLELGVASRETAVDHPWETLVQSMDSDKTQMLPKGQNLLETFDSFNKTLLILGGPGTGKSTTMLELADQLIDRARDDLDAQVPVVFNLSSWDDRTIIGDWLIEELNIKYGVPTRVGRQWIADETITVLLDGLDEVDASHRDDCVDAINKFRMVHGLTGAVVTSRTAEYEALRFRLKLEGSIQLQPLTDKQIDSYLKESGEGLEALRAALKEDPALRELARTPLMLTVMVLSYSNVDMKAMGDDTSIAARRKHLFESFIARMLNRRGANAPYSAEETLETLRWLASQMIKEHRSILMIEQLQPKWLPRRSLRWMYGTIQRAIIIPLLALLVAAGVCVIVMITGAVIGFDLGDVYELRVVPVMASALIGGLIIGLVSGRSAHVPIQPVETLSWSWGWSWPDARLGAWIGVLVGLAMGVFTFFVLEIMVNPLGSPLAAVLFTMGHHLTYWWLIAIGGALAWSLMFGLVFGGLSGSSISKATRPNQGIHYSRRNALIVLGGVGLGLGLLMTGITLFINRVIYNQPFEFQILDSPIIGLGTAGIAGVVMSLIYGGGAVIQHYTLRFLLRVGKLLPFRAEHFLDYAADLVFIRQVGGGYIFIHRLFMEHMAGIDPEAIPVTAHSTKATAAGKTAFWFVPDDTRRKVDTRRIRVIMGRILPWLGGAAALVLLLLMGASNLLPGLFASGENVVSIGGTPGTGQVIAGIGWSEDGTQVGTASFTSSNEPVLTVWDARTGSRALDTADEAFRIDAAEASVDGRTWAVWGLVGDVYKPEIWDVINNRLMRTLPLSTDADSPSPIVWSQDGTLLAIAVRDRASIWDPINGREMKTFGISGGESPLGMYWLQDDKQLAVQITNGDVITYDVEKGAPIGVRLENPLPPDLNIQFPLPVLNRDGTRAAVIAGVRTTSVEIYNVQTQQRLTILEDEEETDDQISVLRWSEDSTRLLVVRELGARFQATVWDVATGSQVIVITLPDFGRAVAWSQDGSRLAFQRYDQSVDVYEVASGALIGTASWSPNRFMDIGLAFSPDGKRIAVYAYGERSVVVTQLP